MTQEAAGAADAGAAVDDATWVLAYDGYDPATEPLREALCTVGNGAWATRGSAPECPPDDDVHHPGTYAAGLYDRAVTRVADRDVENEDLVALPDWLPLGWRIDDGPWFGIDDAEVLAYRQTLDLRRAVLGRELRVRDREGRTTRVRQRRIVSLADPHLGALETTLTAEDWDGRLTVRSTVRADVENRGVARYRDLASRHLRVLGTEVLDPEAVAADVETLQSRVRVTVAARTRVAVDGVRTAGERTPVADGGLVGHDIAVPMTAGSTATVEKVVSLWTSRDPAVSEPGVDARDEIRRAPGLATLLDRHERRWAVRWEGFGLGVRDGSDRALRILRVHVYHLLVTVSEHSAALDTGVPARGWHGEAYRGHVFWDELFIFPFLTLRAPELTRALLLYRYRRLPAARAIAAAEGARGAMFPWQSGSSGREETQTVHLNPASGRWLPDASHLQRHVGLGVAMNVWQYVTATDDVEFLSSYGAELMVEIARCFASLVRPTDDGGFTLPGVMGPDEYHEGYPDADEPGLTDNAYTNVLTVWVLLRARDALARLPGRRRAQLEHELDLGPEELAHWDAVSHRLRVPFHDTPDGPVISQFRGYGDLAPFDWEGYRERYGDIQRLDRILEAEDDSTDRYQLSKQADVLMLPLLLGDEELEGLLARLGHEPDPGLLPRTVAYYQDRTSHGSTLSRVVHAWVLARRDRDRSWEYFTQALESDVGDIQGGTTAEGIHLGAMAGTVDLAQRCWTGLDVRQGCLALDPALPAEVRELAFPLRYAGVHALDVCVTHDAVAITTADDAPAPLQVRVRGEAHQLPPGTTTTIALQG